MALIRAAYVLHGQKVRRVAVVRLPFGLGITLPRSLGSTPACALQGFQGQFNRLLACARCPAIAFSAADKTLAVVVDFDQGADYTACNYSTLGGVGVSAKFKQKNKESNGADPINKP